MRRQDMYRDNNVVVLEGPEVGLRFNRFLRKQLGLVSTEFVALIVETDDDGTSEAEFARDDFTGLMAEVLIVTAYYHATPCAEFYLTKEIYAAWVYDDWSGVELPVDRDGDAYQPNP